jgi:hypothetical protein
MNNPEDKIAVEDTQISDDARKIDSMLDQINQQLVGDQGLMCDGALVYIATALVHSTGDVADNTKKLHSMLDRYVEILKGEHAGCIAVLQESGEQGTSHVH